MDTKCKTSSGAPKYKRWHIERLTSISQLKIVLILLFLFTVLGGQKIFAQGVGISETTIVPHVSAILELRHTGAGPFKGFLTPSMTTVDRDGIIGPATGLIIYNTTTNKLNIYDGTVWRVLFSGNFGVNSVSGTADRITVSETAPDPVIDIAATYVGQASITTLGTIAFGTWEADIVEVPYGGTGLSSITSNNLIYGNNAGAVNLLAPSATTGTILMNTVAGAPSWSLLTDLPSTAGVLPIANGGTGQNSYTNGQLLIGNTTGNTLDVATLTGTANQIAIANGNGSITLSTPQDIHTGASPTFVGLTASGLVINSGVYTDGFSALTSTPPSSGTIGYWDRTGTILSPVTAGDDITTSGNISSSGTGTITSAGLLTGSAGATISGGAINFNDNSNNTTNINTGTSTGAVTIGNAANSISLPAFVTAGLVHNDAAGLLSTGLLVNADINATAAIDATKIADGSVTNTEFQYINTLSSNAQTQIDNINTSIGDINTLADGNIYLGDIGNVAQEVVVSGDITMTNAGVVTIANAAVIGKVLTGYTSGAGVVAATDNILEAIQKLDGNNATNANLTGPITSVGNATAITDDAVTYAKIQDVTASDVVLGRVTVGAGIVEEISTTGSGNVVRATSPTLTTPIIGAATGTSLTLSGDITTKHLIGVAGTPTVTWGSGAGGTPTATSISGKDVGGSISFTTGGAVPASSSLIARITFNTAYSSAPSAVVISGGTNRTGIDIDKIFIDNITTTSFEIWSTSNSLSNTQSYKYYFIVVQ